MKSEGLCPPSDFGVWGAIAWPVDYVDWLISLNEVPGSRQKIKGQRLKE